MDNLLAIHDEGTRSLRRSSYGRGEIEDAGQRPMKRSNSGRNRKADGVPQIYGRAMSSRVEVGSIGLIGSLIGVEKEQRRGEQFRSKSVVWREPMLLLQRMGTRRVPAFFQGKAPRSERQQQTGGAPQEYSSRPSQWVRFWRKFRFDGGRKVHAARPEWLNYDAQSYAMNFEKDRETHGLNSQQMPRISGPGAREIVTVLLKRSSSANRNSGAILIPKPVLVSKQETSAPLWQRRSVVAPSSLEIKIRTPSMRRRSNAAGA